MIEAVEAVEEAAEEGMIEAAEAVEEDAVEVVIESQDGAVGIVGTVVGMASAEEGAKSDLPLADLNE